MKSKAAITDTDRLNKLIELANRPRKKQWELGVNSTWLKSLVQGGRSAIDEEIEAAKCETSSNS